MPSGLTGLIKGRFIMALEIGMYLEENEKKELGTWVPYEGGAEVWIRALSMTDLVKLNRKAKKTVRGGRGGTTEEVDHIKNNRYISREVVRNWRGFIKNGEPIPYSAEMCERYMERNPDFAVFVNEAATNMQSHLTAVHEETEKNLPTTSAQE
jgi:hypothetical protein